VSGLVDAAGHRLAVREAGEGSPVLVLHGFTGCGETLAGVAEALADAHRVVSVDLPGHGSSESPEDPRAFGMEATLDALEDVLDALGVPRAHVLGYSMGGRLALGLAALRPERVDRVVLVGASAGIEDPVARAARVSADEALAESILAGGVPAFVGRWLANPLFQSQRRLGEAFWEEALTQRLRNRPQGLALSLRGMGSGAQPPLHTHLPRLAAPVLAVVGAEDAKFLAIARTLVSRLPHGRLCLIPGAGHAAHLENPAAFRAATRDFLANTEAESGLPATPAHKRSPRA